MKDRITNDKLDRYFNLTMTALDKIKENIKSGRENEAKEIMEMASNYISDAQYFRRKKDFVNAFASLNYAHGWIDSGVRLGIFDVHDNKLFTIK